LIFAITNRLATATRLTSTSFLATGAPLQRE
jgi:hypothetical protein